MTEKDLIAKLNELQNLPAENEVFEFKEAKNGYDFRKIGKYFSALSNEANLKNVECAWLVFGIEDKNKSVVGSNFRANKKDLNSLKKEIADQITNRITFIEIHELKLPEGRVIMFQIPSAPKGIPIAFQGFYYARDNESLGSLNIEEIERIRKQIVEEDWSKIICHNATIDDLDSQAIAKARENYKVKFPDKSAEIDSWTDITFLNKAKITIQGKVTRTAIILLGKEESEHFVDADIKIRWVLKNSSGIEQDHQIESCPFLLAVDKIYSKIRNLRYRYLKEGTLFPDEVDRYEPFVIREAINNCIAHQDYSLRGRINVIEGEDYLIFTNSGSFIPGSVKKVIRDDAPEPRYRNTFLVTAMVNLNMVETIGGGIRKMFLSQSARFFPMPDYDLSDNRVKVTVVGKVLDINYASILARDNDLTLEEIILLDEVQKGKGKSLSQSEANHLKKKGLIEGIKPNYFISARIAQKTGQKAEYTKAKGFDKTKHFELIESFIRQHNYAERKDIDELLWDVLPNWMNEKQKKNRINHLISELRKKNRIINEGSDFKSKWVLLK